MFACHSSIYIQIDGTSDKLIHYIGIIVGVLGPSMEKREIKIKEIKLEDGYNLHLEVIEVLQELKIPGSKFKVLLTDGASAMKKCAELLKKGFPHLLHIICVGHKANGIAEKIEQYTPHLSLFIDSVNHVMSHSKPRQELLAYMTNGTVPTPPTKHDKRFASWNKCANYYYHYFNEIVEFLKRLKAPNVRANNNMVN